MSAGGPVETSRPTLTLTEAAEACDVSRITIRRRLDAKAFPNAFRTDGPKGPDTGPWVIPVDDLLAAGFHLHRPELGAVAPLVHAEPAPAPDALTQLEVELEETRARLARAESERALYQAIAIERGENLADLRIALRALEGPRAAPAPVPAPRQHWWRRRPKAQNEPQSAPASGPGTPPRV